MRPFNLHQKEMLIYPGEKEQVDFWTKKWRITSEQLNQAILETGSIQVKEIKKYLVNEHLLFSFFGFINTLERVPVKIINYFL